MSLLGSAISIESHSSSVFAHIGFGMAAGAVGGGFYRGGGIHGAVRGAIAGGVVGMGLTAAAPALEVAGRFGTHNSALSSFSDHMMNISKSMSTNSGRRATFGAGGLLAGGVFGGQRRMATGLNSQRGNYIGR